MWQRKKLTYDICVPELDKPIALLNSDEAKAYFEWFLDKMPETDFFVKKPLLVGFKDNCVSPPFDAVFEPIHMAGVQAGKILSNGQKEDDLLKVYNEWTKKVIEKQ